MMMLREIEEKKTALSKDLTMVVQISEKYKLKIHFDIVSSKVDKKFRDKVYGLGKTTYSCFLCNVSNSESKDKARILEGFPINRTLKGIQEKAEFLRINPQKLNIKDMVEETEGVANSPMMKVFY